MGLFHVVLLAVIQGLTEFLPVSSSGHVVIAAELLERHGSWPDCQLAFRQPLVPRLVCHCMMKRRRQAAHRQIAWSLQQQFPALVECDPELLEHHLAGAGLKEEPEE